MPSAKPIESQAAFFCGPALLHEAEQMRQSLFISGVLLFRKLTSPLLKLARHFRGLGWRTAKGDQDRGQFLGRHLMQRRVPPFLFHLIGRNDFDAFDALPCDWLALLAPATRYRFDVAEFPKNVVTFD